MDFRFTPEQNAFREDFVAWLEKTLPDDWDPDNPPQFENSDEERQAYQDFQKKLSDAGYGARHYPKEYGGQGRSHVDRMILTEEMMRYGTPAACHWFAERQIGRSIYNYGTEEQKKETRSFGLIMRGG